MATSRRRRLRRRNPEPSGLVSFGLAATAVFVILYAAKRLSATSSTTTP